MKNAGKDIAAMRQTLGVSEATYHRWQSKCGGMKASDAKRLKEFEDENHKLKKSSPNSSVLNPFGYSTYRRS